MKDEDVTTLIKYRLDQAQAALDYAKYLLDGKRSAQSIVNRAYYALFYAALALLQKSDTVPSKHTGVISLFDTEYVMKGVFTKELSKDFHKAFELRQVSDYKTFTSISHEEAEEVLKNATRFVENVKSHLAVS